MARRLIIVMRAIIVMSSIIVLGEPIWLLWKDSMISRTHTH